MYGSYSSLSSIVIPYLSKSSNEANLCTAIFAKSGAYAIGCLTIPTLYPLETNSFTTALLTVLLPAPVLTAVTAITGFDAGSIVSNGPSILNEAPASSAIESSLPTSS